MKRDIIITGDGSHSINVPELNVSYHSIHGAIQESVHVFINAGFYGFEQQPRLMNIFEVGFGTGLNAILTLIEAEKNKIKVYYETVELYPLNDDEVKKLNYCKQLNRPDLQNILERLHSSKWGEEIPITENFTLLKRKENLLTIKEVKPLNLIYFDAFAPNAQAELWTKVAFDKMYAMLEPGGILVTYCSKGDVRRAMTAAGFKVEKLQGPPRKREMLRARRDYN